MKVLAISGWKRSGKDELFSKLANLEAVRVSFADPLKDRVAEEYGIRRSDLDDQSKKESPILHLPVDPQDEFTRTIANLLVREFRTSDGKVANTFVTETNEGIVCSDQGVNYYEKLFWTPRALAIFKGSGNRAVASNYWVQQAITKIQDEFKRNKDLVVIPDMRYKSEMKQLLDAFGNNLVTIRVNRFDTSPSVDPSERDLDDATFDQVIENRSTLADYHAKIDDLIRMYNL
jgi:hypothetical protein